MTATISPPSLPARIRRRVASRPRGFAWTAGDFVDLGSRAAVDKTLQRLVRDGGLRRVGRGLYDRPGVNSMTGRVRTPDYRTLLAAIARRSQARMLVDGMTAANDLGLTTAVPTDIVVPTDGRFQPVVIGKQVIRFRTVAPGRLFWADRPAMRVVQAIRWARAAGGTDGLGAITAKVERILAAPETGRMLRDDLRDGLHTLPGWMRDYLRGMLDNDARDN